MRVGNATVVAAGPGLKARFHLLLCRLVGGAARMRNSNLTFQRVYWWLGRLLGHQNYVDLAPVSGAVVRVHLWDGYWMGRLLRFGEYEPEVGWILNRVLSPDCLFIDCGANIGWWSAIAARAPLKAGTRRAGPPRAGTVVAIEASPTTFARCTTTASLNGGSFECLNAAVWDLGGERLRISASHERHADASVATDDAGATHVVASVTLDEINGRYSSAPDQQVIIKLDVEGAEIEALDGAKELLRRDPLIIFEDHGGDSSSRMTGEMLTRGLNVFFVDSRHELTAIQTAKQATALKSDATRGYNFIACGARSSWPRRFTP